MEHFTINDLALITGLSTRSLRSYISQGLLKGTMINRRWCFTNDNVEEFLNQPFIKEGQRIKFRAFVVEQIDGINPHNETMLLHEMPGAVEEIDKKIQTLLTKLSTINQPYQMKYYYDTKHHIGKLAIASSRDVIREIMNYAK